MSILPSPARSLRDALDRYVSPALPEATGRGVVVCVPERYAALAWGMLASLRRVCDLPVEVHFAGDELSQASKDRLAEHDVSFVDTAAVLGLPPARLRGYQLKPHALAASRFSEVLLADADLLLFDRPELIFDLPEWSGVYLFRDRGFEDRRLRLPRRSMLRLRRAFPELRLPPMHRTHHAEAGLVAWDKARVPTRALLFLNGPGRPTLYRWFFGDKETYWIAAQLDGHIPAFSPLHPGAIVGHDPDTDRPRSPQMAHHHPELETLFWVQGGHLVRRGGRRWPVVLRSVTEADADWRSPWRFRGETVALDMPWLEEIGAEVRGFW